MLARCARCQGTFSTDRYGRQVCPHCGAELILPAPPGTPEDVQPPPEPPRGAAPPPAGPGPGAVPPPPAGGWGPPPPGRWPPPPAGPGFPSPDGPAQPSPFADRARLGVVHGFLETWKLVATQPERFFARVRTDQAWTAILFGVIASTIGTLFSSVYAYFSSQQMLVLLKQGGERLPEAQARIAEVYAQMLTDALSARGLAFQAIATPVFTFVAIYVGAALVHLVLLLLRGGGRGFDATLTAVAYASGLSLLLAVPMCGGLLAMVWTLVSLVIGLGAAQRCGPGKAAAAVLSPFALACVCACGLGGALLGAALKAAAAAKGVPTTEL